jgi:hypothetical protein
LFCFAVSDLIQRWLEKSIPDDLIDFLNDEPDEVRYQHAQNIFETVHHHGGISSTLARPWILRPGLPMAFHTFWRLALLME